MPPRLAENLPTSRAVGAHVYALRTARGWSQRGLARLTEQAGKPIGFGTIARIERNRDPHVPAVAVIVDDLATLATVFNVRPEQLLVVPGCSVCMDHPPAGFACRTCGAEA